MSGAFDAVAVADELAEIARLTRDADTAARLLNLVRRLLAGADLEADDGDGGGELPAGCGPEWRSAAA